MGVVQESAAVGVEGGIAGVPGTSGENFVGGIPQ